MAQTRKLRDGSIGIASTIYLRKKTDKAAHNYAKTLTRERKRKVSKSRVLVETIEERFPA
jgi:hypothetical protein